MKAQLFSQYFSWAENTRLIFFPSSFWSSLAIYTAISLVCQDYEKDQISLILIGNLFSYRALCVIVIDIFAFVLRVPCTQYFFIRNCRAIPCSKSANKATEHKVFGFHRRKHKTFLPPKKVLAVWPLHPATRTLEASFLPHFHNRFPPG